MKRWRGWGSETGSYHLAGTAAGFLEEVVGKPLTLTDATRASILTNLPQSRLEDAPGISTDPSDRLDHSRGQSLPDWAAMHSGDLSCCTDGVSFPLTSDDMRALLKLAAGKRINLIPYGGGSSVLGHINPVASDRPNLTVDLTRMNKMLELDTTSHLAKFEAGASGPQVEEQLNHAGFTLGHFPQSFEYSTVGGWVATRSVGQQSHHYGRIDQMLVNTETETFSGTLVTPLVPASAAGPDLNHLILGSEGRVGIITSATLRVRPLPLQEKFLAAFLPDWTTAVDCVREIAQSGIAVSMLRLSDPMETTTTLQLSGKERLVSFAERGLRLWGMDSDRCLMIYGLTGKPSENHHNYWQIQQIVRKYHGLAVDTIIGDMWQKTRFKTPYLRNTLWEKGYALDTLETCLPWKKVPEAISGIKNTLSDALIPINEKALVFAHLSHLYDEGASMYITYLWRRDSDPMGTLSRWQTLKQSASRVIINLGGTISHQHGVGLDHAKWLAAEKGAIGMDMLRSILDHFDPHGLMNPGKMIREGE